MTNERKWFVLRFLLAVNIEMKETTIVIPVPEGIPESQSNIKLEIPVLQPRQAGILNKKRFETGMTNERKWFVLRFLLAVNIEMKETTIVIPVPARLASIAKREGIPESQSNIKFEIPVFSTKCVSKPA